jgi:hypothetical protein
MKSVDKEIHRMLLRGCSEPISSVVAQYGDELEEFLYEKLAFFEQLVDLKEWYAID